MTKTNAIAVGVVLVSVLFSSPQIHSGGPYQFYSLTPCRVVDTRDPGGPTGGNPISAASHFKISGLCAVPTTATAVALNVTIVSPQNAGHLTLYPYGTAQPGVSTLNFVAWDTLANGAIVPITINPNYNLTVAPFVVGGGSVHVILDVTGYFQ